MEDPWRGPPDDPTICGLQVDCFLSQSRFTNLVGCVTNFGVEPFSGDERQKKRRKTMPQHMYRGNRDRIHHICWKFVLSSHLIVWGENGTYWQSCVGYHHAYKREKGFIQGLPCGITYNLVHGETNQQFMPIDKCKYQ